MTDADAVVLSARLTLLAEVLDAPMSPTRIAGYRALLNDLAFEDIEAALNALGKTCVFFPKPAEIRERVQVARQLRLERERALWRRMRDAEADARLEAHADEHAQALLASPDPPTPYDERAATMKTIITKLKAIAGPPTPHLPAAAPQDTRVRQQIAKWRNEQAT
jgi:hypothetical protein